MNCDATPPTTDLPGQLNELGLHATAAGLEDFLTRAIIKASWSQRMLLQETPTRRAA